MPGVVAVHDLDLPAAALGVALVHAEELGGEERGLVAARARRGSRGRRCASRWGPWRQEDLELLLDRREALGQRRALGGGHLVELVAWRERLDDLRAPSSSLAILPVLLGLRDDRLELGQRLLRPSADGAVVLHERRIRERASDLVRTCGRMSSSFSNMAKLSAVSSQLISQTETSARPLERRRGAERSRGARDPLSGGAGGLLLVALPEALDAAGRVDQLLLAGEERVAACCRSRSAALSWWSGSSRSQPQAQWTSDLVIARGARFAFHGTAHSTRSGAPPARKPPVPETRADPGGV